MKPELYIMVEFLSYSEGGRKSDIYLNQCSYRPHLRVIGETEYLGIEFLDAPDKLIKPHEKVTAKISLIYNPNVSYEKLIEGKEFEILEGPKVVGKGIIISK